MLDGIVRDLPAMSQVNVVQILAELGDGVHRCVGDVAALGQHNIAKFRGHVHDLLYRSIRDARTGCEVENAQVFKSPVRRKREECAVADQFAVGEAKLSKSPPL